MEKIDEALEQLAPRRCVGIVARVYTRWRYGIIVSLAGEQLVFWRRSVIGNADQWVPNPGEAVMFDRALDRRGLKAFHVRPIRPREGAPAPPGAR